jgi:O-antigen ligase
VDPVRATWGQGDDPLDSFTGFRFGLRGVMATKGHFAAIINISILYFFSKNNLISLRENFLSKLFYMFLLLVLFLASGSIASIFAMFFVLYFCNIFNSFTQKNSLKTLISVFLKVLIIPVIFLLNVQFRFLDTFFNRDFTTLTGRSDLWIIGLDLIKKNILLGYGPGGFCLSYELDGTKCEFTDNLSSLKAFVGTAPHNEIVNIVLSYGLVGLILFLLLYLNLYIRLFSLKRRKNIDSINFYFYFIIFSLTVQLLGGFFLSPLNAYWLVFTVIYFLIFHPRHDRSSSALA